jgi:thiamine kinase-like enzyme
VTDEELEFLLGKDDYHILKNALFRAFNTNHLSALRIYQNGSSASHQFLYLFEGKMYWLKLIRKVTLLNDPERQFLCAQLAAERGLSPTVILSDAFDRIIITEFIEPNALTNELRKSRDFLSELAQLTRAIHSLAHFPRFTEIYDIIEGLAQSLHKQHAILPPFVLHYFSYLQPMRCALSNHTEVTACHNDLNPRNITYDGERLWINDWESGCLADPFFDLATAINYFVHGHTKEEQFLREYFNREMDELERAKLFLMKQLSFAYYALTFLNGAARAHVPPMLDEEIAPLPSFHTAQKLIASGVMRLSTPSDLQKLAIIMIKESYQAVISTQYHRAIQLLDSKQLNKPLYQLRSADQLLNVKKEQ